MNCILFCYLTFQHALYFVWYILLASPLKLNNHLFHSEKIWTNNYQNNGPVPAWRGLQRGHREVNGLLVSIYSWVTFLQSGFISCKTNYQITRHTHIQMQVKKYGKPCMNCFRFYTFLFSSISINNKLTILLHFISFILLSLFALPTSYQHRLYTLGPSYLKMTHF